MHKIFIIFLISFSLFLSCVNQNNINSNKILLADDWMLQSSAEIKEKGKSLSLPEFNPKGWYPTSVPTTVLAALIENEVYPDPYFGDNLKSIPGYRDGRWLAMHRDSPFYPSWWYRNEFEIPKAWAGKNIVLHFDGINYKVNVWLNGHHIADTTQVIGMFRRFEFDINPWVQRGETNILAVEVFGPGRIPDIAYRTKQVEATTGWDDHNPQPPDLNMGLWEDVYITAGGAVGLRHPYVVTDLDLPSLETAHLTVSVELSNKSTKGIKGIFSGNLENITFQKEVSLSAGETKIVMCTPDEFPALNIKNPRLWWPHPVGPQELYDMELTFRVGNNVSARETVRFGVREVSTYINEEGWRGYKINGKNILIRGGAWMTSDMLLRLTPGRYEALVRYAREANLNALRSEGFSIRETEEFYNMCDQYGIMVIQQIFGRSIPDENLAVDLIKDMILRIRNHPSLVHFLGHDETFPTEYLDQSYRALITQYTPQRTYQPHSGAFHIEDRFKTGGTRTGTLELWTYATPSHYYTHKEDGAWGFAQSGGIGGIIAPYESIRRMMPESAQWPIYNDTFSFHTVLQGIEYFELGLMSMEKRYGKATGIKDFCLKGQVMNYESARGMYEAYARNKYDALGITTWKYDAAWPAAMTWQYVDWYLNVGGAYYGAKKACEPLHVQYSYDDHSIYVLNSFYIAYENLKVTSRIFNIDMTEIYANTTTVNINADGKTEAFKIVFPDNLSTTYFLALRLEDDKGNKISDNFYWLSTVPDIQGSKDEVRTSKGWGILKARPKSYANFKDLKKISNVKLETKYVIHSDNSENMAIVRVKNPEKHLAFMIHLAVVDGQNGDEILPTYWEDNYFSLLPGEEREINAVFSNEDLGKAGVVVKVDGWNIE
jgi:exo-1,4-beta-D-glucosaminidase